MMHHTIAAADTATLYDAAHDALMNARWSAAVRLLEALALRADSNEALPSAGDYGVPEDVHQLVQDRIDAVNGRVHVPGVEECEDNDCAGCSWCDARGITA